MLLFVQFKKIQHCTVTSWLL